MQVVILWYANMSFIIRGPDAFLYSILDVAHIICAVASLYHYLVGKYGNVEALVPLIP